MESPKPAPVNEPVGNGVKPAKPTHVKHAHRFIFGYIALLVIAAVAGYASYIYHQHYQATNSNVAQTQKVDHATQAPPKSPSDVCFITFGSSAALDCVDANGKNLVSHALPVLGGQKAIELIPNDTDTEYLGYNGSSWWLLDKNLYAVRQLTFPSGLAYSVSKAVSWSHDGKYMFIELDKDTNNVIQTGLSDRQIYKYTLANGEVTKLTTEGSNSSPFQTQDGHILYSYFSGNGGWLPYIMNADGSNPKELASLSNPTPISGSDTTEFTGLSYDAATDTVFVDNFGGNQVGSGTVSYETVSNLLAGMSSKTIPLNVSGSGDGDVLRINDTTILWPNSTGPNDNDSQFINLENGKVENTITQYGDPVGVLANVDDIK